MKAECKNCVMAQPNDGAESKKGDWTWPEDYECGCGNDEFPDTAYLCIDHTPVRDGAL